MKTLKNKRLRSKTDVRIRSLHGSYKKKILHSTADSCLFWTKPLAKLLVTFVLMMKKIQM